MIYIVVDVVSVAVVAVGCNAVSEMIGVGSRRVNSGGGEKVNSGGGEKVMTGGMMVGAV